MRLIRASPSENQNSKNRIEALKRLSSVGFVGEEGNHKTLLLKIMSRPLMEHRHDYFNDAVRVCALTIDIRYESNLFGSFFEFSDSSDVINSICHF